MRDTYTAVEVVRVKYFRLDPLIGNTNSDFPVFIGTDPRISTPSSSHRNCSDKTIDASS
jgi:hypothetical protein